MSIEFYSSLGPGSDVLSRDVINSRTEVTRAGQQNQSAFVDPFVWNKLIIRTVTETHLVGGWICRWKLGWAYDPQEFAPL